MAEFFTSVMKFKQEDMKYVNWSNKKISMRSFVCIMHLADPEIYDKSNYDLVTNGKGIEFGEIVNDKPRWIATFETTNERSGVAFIVQKPLSKGLTKANKFELCAQLRKRHEICSDMFDVKHNSENRTIAETSSDDWLFFAMFVSPDFEYPNFTSGPIPFNLNGKMVFLTLRRKENLKQLEERLKQTTKTEEEIRAILMRKKSENFVNSAKIEERLERATVEELRTEYALNEIGKIDIVEPLLDKKQYLSIKIQQAKTKFEKERYQAKREILMREDKKAEDRKYFQLMRDQYDIENKKNSGKWKKLFTNSMRLELCTVMNTYEEKAKAEDELVTGYYMERFGHLDKHLENEYEMYRKRTVPQSPIIGGMGSAHATENLESTKNAGHAQNLERELLEAVGFDENQVRQSAKRKRVFSPPNNNADVAENDKFNETTVMPGSDAFQTIVNSSEEEDEQNAEPEGMVWIPSENRWISSKDAVWVSSEKRWVEKSALVGQMNKELDRDETQRQEILSQKPHSLSLFEGPVNRAPLHNASVPFITSEAVHVANTGNSIPLGSQEDGASPPKIATNSRNWGHWNRRTWVYFLNKQESDGVNCLKHDLDWAKDNLEPFMGKIFTRANAREHLKKLQKLISISGKDVMPDDEDDFFDMKAALYFLGPRNKGVNAIFSRENLESLDWPDLKRLPGKLVDLVGLRKLPPKIQSLVPIWVQVMTLVDEEERHRIWSYGATQLGVYARSHLDTQGVWRLITNRQFLQFQKYPQDAIGKNIIGLLDQDIGDSCLYS